MKFFEMKNGKVYKAFRNGVEMGRKFLKLNGKLYNDAGHQEEGRYSGCAWVPPGAGFTFEETTEKPQKVFTKTAVEQAKDSFLTLKPGIVYYWKRRKEYVILSPNGAYYFSTRIGTKIARIEENIPLTDSFRQVKKSTKTLRKNKRATRGI